MQNNSRLSTLIALGLLASSSVFMTGFVSPIIRQTAPYRHVGVYQLGDITKLLTEFPNASTYLQYMNIDWGPKLGDVLKNLDHKRYFLDTQQRRMVLQIGLQMREGRTLKDLLKDARDPNSVVSKNLIAIGEAIARQTEVVYLRPLSEMNDLNSKGWAVGRTAETQARFVEAWKLVIDRIRSVPGTERMRIHFNVLGSPTISNQEITIPVLKTLLAMKDAQGRGYVDAFGLNVYSRPVGAKYEPAYQSVYPRRHYLFKPYVSFRSIVEPWLDALRNEGIHLPLAIGEMGASNQGQDQDKAIWIREAFEVARKYRFFMVTYFNQKDTHWAATAATDSTLSDTLLDEAERELSKQISQGI